MAYWIDRGRAVRVDEIVAVLSVVRPRARSCAVLRDGALHYTLTRPRTIARWLASPEGLVGLGGAAMRAVRSKPTDS